jgi:hypothetical protein
MRTFWHAESWKWSASGIAETKRRGDVVCRAIEAYRAKTGKYPFQLSDLQPEFLRELPQPTVGDKQWEYTPIDRGANYQLQVFASEFGPQLEKTSTGPWYYMDQHGTRNI